MIIECRRDCVNQIYRNLWNSRRTGNNVSIQVDDDDDDWSSTWSNETVEPQMKHEYRLLRDLMTNYDPAALPAHNISDVVTVKMGIALFQIRELVRINTRHITEMTDRCNKNKIHIR